MGELRLVLHITKAADGSLMATLNSVDQGANDIPVKSAILKGSKLNLDVTAVQGIYEELSRPIVNRFQGRGRKGNLCLSSSSAPLRRSRPNTSRQKHLTSMERGWARG
ncbi:MAG: hypothetical protein DMG78_04995 [Acidobacteria bacterium]|nr:MAG: hypothetical protein DMG78_04995 [Acidobacteriota bacterium]